LAISQQANCIENSQDQDF